MELINAIKNIPFFRVLFPFILGIVVQDRFQVSMVWNAFFLILLLFLLLYLSFSKKEIFLSGIELFGVFVFLFFLSSGGYLVAAKEKSLRVSSSIPEREMYYVGEIMDELIEKPNTYATKIKIQKVWEDDSLNVNNEVLAYIQKDSLRPDFIVGDRVLFKARLQQITSIGNLSSFDYQEYMYRKGVLHSVYIKKNAIHRIQKSKGLNLKRDAVFLSAQLNQMLENYLSNENLPIAQAMVLGKKDNLDGNIKNAFASAGIMHILAISGLHVGILFLLLNTFWTAIFKNRHRLFKALFIICIIWIYAFVVGLPPSVQRASLMLSIMILGVAIGRSYQAMNSVFIAAFLILLYDPYVFFTVSFQLSFTAVMGILIIYPRLVLIYLPKNIFAKYFWQILVVSFAAQMATLPLTLYYFNYLPTFSLVANFYAIPLAFIIFSGCLALFTFAWLPPVAAVIGKVLDGSIDILRYLSQRIDRWEYARITNIELTEEATLLMYFLIGSLIAFHVFRRVYWLKLAGLSFIAVLLIQWPGEYRKQPNMLLNATEEIINVRTKNGQILKFNPFECERTECNAHVSAGYPTFPVEAFGASEAGFPLRIQYNGTMCMILYSELIPTIHLYTDYLILMGEQAPQVDEIIDKLDFNTLVLHPSLPWFKRKDAVAFCNTNHIPYVEQEGSEALSLEYLGHKF